MNEKILFPRSWLPIEKKQFRILAMLAAEGDFEGNLSDLCRYFRVDPQTRNRNQLRQALQSLSEQGYIVSEQHGNKFHVSLVPKEEETLQIPREWFEAIRTNPNTENVAWENVVKVLLWLFENGSEIFTNNEIAGELDVSVSTVVTAKNVLEREFSAITKEYKAVKISEDTYRRIGQKVDICAWWDKK